MVDIEKKEFELKEEKQDSTVVDAKLKAVQAASTRIDETVVKLFDISSQVLLRSIEQTRTYPGIGLLALMAYIDLLHGGAFRVPVGQLPSCAGDGGVASSPYYDPNLTVPSTAIFKDIYLDSNAPHILPKLLSDQIYDDIKGQIGKLDFVTLFQLFNTALSTLVEAGSNVIKAVD